MVSYFIVEILDYIVLLDYLRLRGHNLLWDANRAFVSDKDCRNQKPANCSIISSQKLLPGGYHFCLQCMFLGEESAITRTYWLSGMPALTGLMDPPGLDYWWCLLVWLTETQTLAWWIVIEYLCPSLPCSTDCLDQSDLSEHQTHRGFKCSCVVELALSHSCNSTRYAQVSLQGSESHVTWTKSVPWHQVRSRSGNFQNHSMCMTEKNLLSFGVIAQAYSMPSNTITTANRHNL